MGLNPNTDKLHSRQIALEILYVINKGHTLKEAFETPLFLQLTEEARPFTKFLVTQTMRYKNALVKIFEQYLQKKPQNKSREFVYELLTLGTCELLLSKQKPNVTLNSYTEITKIDKKTAHLSGVIRAILGKVSQNKADLLHYLQDYPLIFGHDLYHLIQSDYPQDVDQICLFLLQEPAIDVLKINQIQAPTGYVDLLPRLMRYQSGMRPEKLGLFEDGELTIQSFASHLPLYGAGDLSDKKILDLCAAPGGKTIQALSQNADVTSVDISSKRVKRLEENLQRCHLSAKIEIQNFLDYHSDEKYDIILLDAPCSAIGTIRKNPDIIHNFTLTNMGKLQLLQKKMLQHAIQFLHKDGILIYAVCSLSHFEGEKQIMSFLQDYPQLKLMTPPNIQNLPSQIITEQKMIRLLPHHNTNFHEQSAHHILGHDGFFVAYLQYA